MKTDSLKRGKTMSSSLPRTILQSEVKDVNDMARYLVETFTWFGYEKQNREKRIQEIIDTCDHNRIEKAYKWFIDQEYDYMSYGEVIQWAMDYVCGEQDIL